jgi:hypothetical protein
MFNWTRDIWPFRLLYRIPKPITFKPIVPVFVEPEKLIQEGFYYNPDFYATQETTREIMERFNAMVMFEKTITDGEKYPPVQWFVRFPDGLEINAGQLAKFFSAYPEEKYPNIAVRYGVNVVAMHRQGKYAEEEYNRRRAMTPED